MARLRSPEKRRAILEGAVVEIAESGLGAATAKIAARAGVAEGTLFTYFANKDELLNELYVELKLGIYERVNAGFPHTASLERRAWHVWSSSLSWSIEFPEKRKVSLLLNLSAVVTPESRARLAEQRTAIDAMFAELGNREALRGLPAGYAAALMSSVQEATMDFIAKGGRQRKALVERGFALFWRAVR
jgi:AcrR family transcriptional regulator